MSETTPPPPAQPAAPAARTANDIKRDPLVVVAVSRDWEAVTDAKEFANEITLFVDRQRIVPVCRSFKDEGFNYLVDLSGVDYSKYPGHTGLRFGVSYTLYSFRANKRIRISITDWKPAIITPTMVPSVAPAPSNANALPATVASTCERRAPSATRIPISRVRRVTMNESSA